MHITWNEDLALGNQLVDDQHRRIFAVADDFLQAMLQGQGRSQLEEMMKFLGEYVADHFTAEETLMIQNDYPGYADHKEQHIEFMVSFEEIRAECERTGATSVLAIRVNQLVSSWLRMHIRRVDKLLAEYLAGKDPD